MARTKSTPGSKTSRTNATSEQPASGAANPAETKAVPAATIPANVVVEPKTKAEQVMPEKIAPEAKKIEMVKTEPRKNVVAINRAPLNLEEEIRRRAYEIYQRRGNAPGSQAEDWLAAEREIRKRYQQHTA